MLRGVSGGKQGIKSVNTRMQSITRLLVLAILLLVCLLIALILSMINLKVRAKIKCNMNKVCQCLYSSVSLIIS